MTAELARVLSHFNAVSGKALCPFCGHNSLFISAGKKQPVIVHCFNCQNRQAELVKLVLDTASDEKVPIRKVKETRSFLKEWTECQLRQTLTASRETFRMDTAAQAFLKKRFISLETAQSFSVGSGVYYGTNRIVIPYLDGMNVLQLRYRQLDNFASKLNKWRCDKRILGGRRLFNLPLLQNWNEEDVTPVVTTESELDCMMLSSLGMKSLSVDSAGHQLIEEDLRLLRRVKRLIIAFDQDEAGNKCTWHFKRLLPSARVFGGYGKLGKDVGELCQACGPEKFTAGMNMFFNRKR